MRYCNNCRTINRQVDFIGKDNHIKLFESTCLLCGYNYIFRINTINKKYMKTDNLNIYKLEHIK